MEIVIATNNKDKIIEYRNILKEFNIKCLSLKDLNIVCDPLETGTTFQENSLIKAQEIAKFTDKMIIADDSGIEVDELVGELGVYSHRFLENESYSVKNATVIEMLKDKVKKARYVCVVALVNLTSEPICFEGICEGIISDEIKGSNGFGYDPIFMPLGYNNTFGELSSELKHSISHRGIATVKLVEYLKGIK